MKKLSVAIGRKITKTPTETTIHLSSMPVKARRKRQLTCKMQHKSKQANNQQTKAKKVASKNKNQPVQCNNNPPVQHAGKIKPVAANKEKQKQRS